MSTSAERKATAKAVMTAALEYVKVNPLREEWVEVDDNLREAVKAFKRARAASGKGEVKGDD